MIPLSKQRMWPLAIAAAVALAGATSVGSETDSDDMIFMPPTVGGAPAVRNTNELPPPQKKPLPRTIQPGRAVINKNIETKTGAMKGSRPLSEINPNAALKPGSSNLTPKPSPIIQASSIGNESAVMPANHNDPLQGVTPDGADPILLKERRSIKRGPNSLPMITSPMDRPGPPGVRGALLGLNGETATERLLQLKTASLELERENEELRQHNAALIARVKETHDQMAAGVREMQLARKELAAARGDLDRLKSEMQSLRDKVRIAEREYSAVLQSMGPLLQQLLESDDVSSLPPNPTE